MLTVGDYKKLNLEAQFKNNLKESEELALFIIETRKYLDPSQFMKGSLLDQILGSKPSQQKNPLETLLSQHAHLLPNSSEEQ